VSRLVRFPLEVRTDSNGVPLEVKLKGVGRRVQEVLDRWRDTGCWWEGEAAKLFWRLQLEGGRIWEVYHDLSGKGWYLYKIYD